MTITVCKYDDDGDCYTHPFGCPDGATVHEAKARQIHKRDFSREDQVMRDEVNRYEKELNHAELAISTLTQQLATAEAELAAIHKAASEPDESVTEALSGLQAILRHYKDPQGASHIYASNAVKCIHSLQRHRAAESQLYKAACEQMRRDDIVIKELNDELKRSVRRNVP